MSIQEVTYYRAVCDCCGKPADYGDFAAWSEPGAAGDFIPDEWTSVPNADNSVDDLCGDCCCWPEDLPDYPGDEAWKGGDDPVRKHAVHPTPDVEIGRQP